jgi:hypothetical protein
MDALQSPPQKPTALDQAEDEAGGPSRTVRIVREMNSDENPDDLDEDYMKVRLYFFNQDPKVKARVFTEEWYVVAQETLDDQFSLTKQGVPFIEVR